MSQSDSPQPAIDHTKWTRLPTDRLRYETVQGALNQFANRPDMVRKPKLHGRRDAQGFVHAAKIVVADIKADRRFVVLEFLAERVGQPRVLI